MSDQKNITFNPSDVLGAVQRALTELHTYIAQPPQGVDVRACRAHLAHVFELLDVLETQQASMAASQGGENGEARAN
jgi:hypothetical protein